MARNEKSFESRRVRTQPRMRMVSLAPFPARASLIVVWVIFSLKKTREAREYTEEFRFLLLP